MSCLHARGAGRRHSVLRGGFIAAGTAAVLLSAVGPAAADTAISDVVWLKPVTVSVAGNGSRYTTVEPSAGNVEGQIRVDLDARILGRVKSFDAWPLLHLGFEAGESETLGEGFKGTGMSKSMTYTSPRPKKVAETFFFSIPRARYQEFLVKACNRHADELREAGQSDSEIFEQDWTIQVFATSRMSYEMTGADRVIFSDAPQAITAPDKFDVICKRLPPRVPNPIAGSNLLIRTEQESNHAGACELRLQGTISTHVPNVQVKFRYVHGDGQQSDLKTVTTDAQGFVNFTHNYPLPNGIKGGKIRMVGEGPTFQSDWADFEADCALPPQGVATVLPPKAIAIEAHATGDEIMHRGLACPANLQVWGVIKGRGSVDGHVALAADGKPKALEPYSIVDGQTVVVSGDHTLAWGPTQAQQNVKFAMYVTNKQGEVVDQMETTQNFTCRETPGVAEGAVGGVTTGKPAPTHAQQVTLGGLAAPQGFAILAPKGLVRQGQVRLSGGAATAKYTLKFLRKNGGGYTAVNAAQLPNQMTGPVANFPLKALTGGRDWRLEVCPLGVAAAACKTADFRLTRIGAAAGSASSPSPEQPQGTVFIFPGAAN